MLDELTHAVQCRDINTKYNVGWHTIAAFDLDIVAERYAEDCRESSKGMDLAYRVVEIERSQI